MAIAALERFHQHTRMEGAEGLDVDDPGFQKSDALH
jgi:hypothetical protein